MSKAIVIGAGIAGIASGIRLVIKGYQVEVFEAGSVAGGKLSELNLGDFRFDTGPSLFTMPQYVDELFALAGKDSADYFQYEKLEIVCNYF
jgi:phytoene dehydrogenase-like protein